MRPVPLAALALAAFPLFAQEKIEVSVVNVDVTVTDHGKPVAGLTKDDFEVLDDGAPQAITNFYAVNDSEVGQDERFRRKVLLVLDRRSISRYEFDRALARFEAYIDSEFHSGEYVWSVASMDSSLRILLPPTSDKKAILNALQDIRHGQGYSSETARRVPTSVEMYGVDAVVEAVRAFATTGGKKVLLVLTGHLFETPAGAATSRYAYQTTYTRDELIEEANASNVNLYVINPEGAEASDSTNFWITRQTGGQVLSGGKLGNALRQFDTASGNFYSLGFRPAHNGDAKYHHLKVRVRKGSYALQYRDGYYDLSDYQQMQRSFGSTFGTLWEQETAIPVSIAFEKTRDVEGASIVSMKTTVPADQAPGTIDIFISVFDSDGRSVWQVQLTRDASAAKESGKYNENTEMYFHKDKPYRVVVAVRDRATEAVGVTQQVVKF